MSATTIQKHRARYPCLTMTPSRTLATSSQRSVASSRKSSVSFHFMTTIGSRSSSNSRLTACWWMRSASFSSRLISIGVREQPLAAARARRARAAPARCRRVMICASSRAPKRTDVEPVEADQRRRRVDRVHHVVERPRQRVDVLAIERRDERAVEALDDLVRQEVALVLDFLDLVGLVPDRALRREHLLEQPGAALQLVGERLEIGVELLFARNQSERHAGSRIVGGVKTRDCSRSVYTAVTRAGADAPAVYHLLIAWPMNNEVLAIILGGGQGIAPVSADAAPLEAGGADRRQLPPDRHPDQQLPARRHPPHLRADAVQLGVAQPAHLADLPDGSRSARASSRSWRPSRRPTTRTGSRARPTPCGRRRATSSATTPTTT